MNKETIIKIYNFGPIKEFEYDLDKPFIVTYGDNNIGKSYAMQVVYLLLKVLIDFAKRNKYYYFYFENDRGMLKFNKLFSVLSDDTVRIDITQEINALIEQRVEASVMSELLNSFENTFGNFNDILNQHPKITVSFGKYSISIDLKMKKLEANFYDFPTYLKKTSSRYHNTYKTEKSLTVYYYGEKEITSSRITEYIDMYLMKFKHAIYTRFSDVYFLPASRSGIYSGMSAFSSIVAELSKNKAILSKKIELPGISEPISDYFIMLSNIRTRENSMYESVYKQIEEDVLKGIVKYNKRNNTIVYVPKGLTSEFEMTEVSSMVSEISPIVAFLKYIIGLNYTHHPRNTVGDSIVFIEEPEAHLHPHNQIKLIEIFSQLPQLGVNVILSSHSNYVFNKLNNLLLSKKISPSIYEPIILEQTDFGSVSRKLDIDDLGVTDENFSDTTEKLYEEREAIIEQLMSGE